MFRRVTYLRGIVLAAVLVGFGAVLSPQRVVSDAVACTYYNGSPGFNNCYPWGSGGCYYCEYSFQYGYSTCHESPSGDVRYCIDYSY
jgi:hypothetical protein